MYTHTKKVGSLGRYGARVGRKPRNEALKIENESRKSRSCPTCVRGKVKKVSAGIWKCRTCSFTFCGGTHIASIKRKVSEE